MTSRQGLPGRLTGAPVFAVAPQEVERGLLFPRFSALQAVSATLTAEVAEGMVRAGQGSRPDDFDEAVQGLPRRGGVSAWEAYVRMKMYKIDLASKL